MIIAIRKDLPPEAIAFECSICHATLEVVPDPNWKLFTLRDESGRDHERKHSLRNKEIFPITAGAWGFLFGCF